MTNPEKPPNPRPWRRRRLVVLILLASIAAWWYWPRNDPRFVGKWRMSPQSVPEEVSALTLYSSGLARWSAPGFPGSVSFPWRIDSQFLVFGNEAEGRWARTIQALAGWIHKHTSHEFAYGDGEDRYRVISIAPDEIRLEDDQGAKLLLRRITE
jgi:hypothetical protein